MRREHNYRWIIPFILGLFLPGWGQIYNGKVKQGIALAVIFPLLMIAVVMGTLHLSQSVEGNRFGLLLLFLLYMSIVFHGTLFCYFKSPKRSSWPFILISALLLRYGVHEPLRLLSKSFLVHTYTIPSKSMLNTLLVGDMIVSNSSAYGSSENIKIGDIAIFRNIVDDDLEYVKRVLAAPGDLVSVDSTDLYRNGELVEMLPPAPEDTVRSPSLRYSFRVPAGGDTLSVDTLTHGEFLFHAHLISQELRRHTVTAHLYLSGDDRFLETVDLDTVTNLYKLEEIVRERSEKYNYLKRLTWKPYLFIDGEQKSRYIYREDSFFLVGDNRRNSYDSRFFGPVSSASILSRVEMVLLSFSTAGGSSRLSRIGKAL